ncbi:MAG: hypothetical protein CMP10_06630, partial [Zetaproteobacteria bacterium]|nr:hypothetical protein [Pseudobdellovibrionaceae bacterium]
AGLEDGILPHHNSLEDSTLIEEERRLFYVGITRARKKLSISCAQSRRTWNQVSANPPSRFLEEVPKECLSIEGEFDSEEIHQVNNDLTNNEVSYEFDNTEIEPLRKGGSVWHPTYGKGIVEGFDHSFGQNKVVVRFVDFGCRKIRPSQLESLPHKIRSELET